MPHLIVAPIVLPLLAMALMLLGSERRRRARAVLNLLACGANLVIAVTLLRWVDAGGAPGAIGVYLPGNWPMPFGLVLAIDRLSALLLVLTAAVALAALLFALARWHRAGVHFHPLFQIQLMGLNGVFLTADLFNLFVFFEIMLAASYGLLMHGSGQARVKAGLHYIAFNLGASLLFLIGVAVLYGVTGTLNIADMARKLPQVPADDRALLLAGAAILALAFLGKAAMWPLNFWLAPAYAAAGAPVAALFALMTKVGVYAIVRLWTLLFPAVDGAGVADVPASFGAGFLVWGGLATLGFGAIGMLASQRLGRLAGFSLIVSSGTLIAAFGFGEAGLSAAAIFYLASSTLGVAAMFLLAELMERARQSRASTPLYEDVLPDGRPAPFVLAAVDGPDGRSLEDDDDADVTPVGRAVPAGIAFLGMSFIASALVVAGLPPLAGFVAKVALIGSALSPGGTVDAPVSPEAWVLAGALIVSGLFAVIALSRAGLYTFWTSHERAAPRLRPIEVLPVAALLAACAALTVQAEPAMRYARQAADALYQPQHYIDTVLATRPRPGPATPDDAAQAPPEAR